MTLDREDPHELDIGRWPSTVRQEGINTLRLGLGGQ